MLNGTGPRRLARKRVRDALIATGGSFTAAAKLIGCSRENIGQMVRRHKELEALCAELTETKLDTLEDTLYELGTKERNVTAAIATLNAKAKHRGWGYYKTDVHVAGEVTHRHLLEASERFRELSDAELARLLEARLQFEDSDRRLITVYPPKPETETP